MIVTFSGIDGSGKSTRCETLVHMLCNRGLPAVISKPSYEANNAIKDFCEWTYGDRFAYFERLDGEFYISCLTADWLAYLARVLQTKDSRILVCDRYIHDVLAQALHMQATARELLSRWSLFPQPDISYFLAIPPETAYTRLKLRVHPPIHVAEELIELRTLADAYHSVRSIVEWRPTLVTEDTDTGQLATEVERTWTRTRTLALT
jgi:thymidylate kinase